MIIRCCIFYTLCRIINGKLFIKKVDSFKFKSAPNLLYFNTIKIWQLFFVDTACTVCIKTESQIHKYTWELYDGIFILISNG